MKASTSLSVLWILVSTVAFGLVVLALIPPQEHKRLRDLFGRCADVKGVIWDRGETVDGFRYICIKGKDNVNT